MTKLRPELYVGREQTYVKHFVLENYLEKLAYKIGVGWKGATLNYVDGFAGPWQSQDEQLSDTSPHIAVRVLRGVRDELKRLGRPPLGVRAMFVEKQPIKFTELMSSFAGVADIHVDVRSGEFENLVSDAVTFGSVGPRGFCFTLIDPCGWTGYGLAAITPLLRVQPGEVLINFMYDEINRFIDHPEPANAATFADLFGSTTVPVAWVGLQGLNRQEAIVGTYCDRVRDRGGFTHVVSAVIINPLRDRAHYHLVYATRSDEGLRTFREIERKALQEQVEMRAGAQQRSRQASSGGQRELFRPEVLATPYVDELEARYHERAKKVISDMLTARSTVPFDELAVAGMQQPMTAEQDVRDFLIAEVKRGAVAFDGLSGKQRTPQWNKSHTVRLLTNA